MVLLIGLNNYLQVSIACRHPWLRIALDLYSNTIPEPLYLPALSMYLQYLIKFKKVVPFFKLVPTLLEKWSLKSLFLVKIVHKLLFLRWLAAKTAVCAGGGAVESIFGVCHCRLLVAVCNKQPGSISSLALFTIGSPD